MNTDKEYKSYLIGAIAETMKAKALVENKLDFDGGVMLLSLAFKSIPELEKISKLAGVKARRPPG